MAPPRPLGADPAAALTAFLAREGVLVPPCRSAGLYLYVSPRARRPTHPKRPVVEGARPSVPRRTPPTPVAACPIIQTAPALFCATGPARGGAAAPPPPPHGRRRLQKPVRAILLSASCSQRSAPFLITRPPAPLLPTRINNHITSPANRAH